MNNMFDMIEFSVENSDYEQARNCLEELKLICEDESKSSSEKVDSYFHLGKSYKLLKMMDESRRAFLKCVNFPRQTNEDSMTISEAYLYLSTIHSTEGNEDEALKYSLKSMKILTNDCPLDMKFMKILNKAIDMSNRSYSQADKNRMTPHLPSSNTIKSPTIKMLNARQSPTVSKALSPTIDITHYPIGNEIILNPKLIQKKGRISRTPNKMKATVPSVPSLAISKSSLLNISKS